MEPISRDRHVKGLIRRRYSHVADTAVSDTCAYERVLAAGYQAAELDGVPQAAISRWSGCGNLAERVDLAGVERIVDLGCGGGLDLWLLFNKADRPASLLGIDITEGMPAMGNTGPDFVVGDMEELPLSSASCDLAIANAALNLAVDLRGALLEIARILRPGGRLHIMDLIRDGELPCDILTDPMGHSTSLGGVPTEPALRKTIEEAGFYEVSIGRYRPFPPVLAVEVLARIAG